MHLMLGFIIAQVIIFGAVIFILKRVIFNDTTSAVNRLSKLDDLNREKERQLVERLDETEKQLMQKREEMQAEENRMKQEAERSAIQLHENIVNNAKKEAEDLVKKAIAAREKMRLDAMVEAETKTVDFSRQIVHKVLTEAINDAVHHKLFTEFIAELERTDMSIINKTVRQADVYAAKKIEDEIMVALKNMLMKKLDRPIDVKMHEDPTLIGGVLLKFGTLVIDDSLLEHINQSAKELKEAIAHQYKQT